MPTTDPLALACELIRRPSVTPDDSGCQALLSHHLEALGFHCEALRFGEVDNLWAERGDAGPLFVFAGHTDVVPSGPEAAWRTPPFDPTVEDGVLTGRGAADMKAALAAMVVACERFVTAHPDHPDNGTVKVMQWLKARGEHIRWCLVGEPSSTAKLGDVIKNGRRGSLNGALTVKGTQGHIAYPQLADNPIHRALPALAELAAENVIPGELRVRFNFRYSTELTADEIRSRTEAILDRHDLAWHLDWRLSGEPFLTPRGELVDATLDSIRECLGLAAELSTGGGTSDGRFIAPSGAQVLELGHVNATIHQVDEAVAVADVPRLAEVYQRILEKLLLSG